jgi:hypothetical protein
MVSLTQTSPQQRDILLVNVDQAAINPYLPSARNPNRPALEIDQPVTKSSKPLVEVRFGSQVFLSLSQVLERFGAYNGRYGLSTVKKMFRLQIADAPVTIYNTQHWKTHGESTELPESYVIRFVNNANGNIVQISSQKWDETRAITKISHSYDGGKTLTTALKVDQDYAVPVGKLFFYKVLGSRNIQGLEQLSVRLTSFFHVNNI